MGVVNWRMKALLIEKVRGPLYEAAAQLGMDPTYLSKIINGRRRPSEKDIKRIARLIGEKETREVLSENPAAR